MSVTIRGCPPEQAASVLDAEHRVQVRSGIHCAPRMHAALGTLQAGGTVRFSLGALNTEDEIDAAVAAVRRLAARGGVTRPGATPAVPHVPGPCPARPDRGPAA